MSFGERDATRRHCQEYLESQPQPPATILSKEQASCILCFVTNIHHPSQLMHSEPSNVCPLDSLRERGWLWSDMLSLLQYGSAHKFNKFNTKICQDDIYPDALQNESNCWVLIHVTSLFPLYVYAEKRLSELIDRLYLLGTKSKLENTTWYGYVGSDRRKDCVGLGD